MTDNIILLSDILKSCQQLSFFHEILDLSQLESTTSECLLNYDMLKIDATIADVQSYLSTLLEIFREIDQADIASKDSPTWVLEGKNEILDVCKKLESIDTVVSQLLVLLENRVLASQKEYENAKFVKSLESFSKIGDLSLKAKRYSIIYKKRLDIAVAYNELESQVLKGIDDEISKCTEQSLKIIDIAMQSPHKKLPEFNLEMLSRKLNSNNPRSLNLPIFNGADQSLYDQFVRLDDRVKPLSMALEFVPQALDNFKLSFQEFYPDLMDVLAVRYADLQERLILLNDNLKNIKLELVDKKWGNILMFLMTESVFLSKDIDTEVAQLCSRNITKELNYKISIMDQTITILDKSVSLGLLTIKEEFYALKKQWSLRQRTLSKIKRNSGKVDDDAKIGILSSIKKDYDSFDFVPGFTKKSQKLKELKNANAASPTKVSKKKAMGSAIVESLNIQPIYSEATPIHSVADGKKMINANELTELRKSNLAKKLSREADKDDTETISSLNMGIANMKLECEVGRLEERTPIIKKSSLNQKKTISLKELIHNNKDFKSKIPIAKTQGVSVLARSSNARPERVKLSTATAQIPSMIPRPTSRMVSSRCSSRASSRCSARTDVSENSYQKVRPSTSLCVSRASLSNITNISNNSSSNISIHSTPKIGGSRSKLPTPIRGAIGRPASSLSSFPSSRKLSISSNDFF